MSFSEIISFYLNINLLVCVAYFVLWFFGSVFRFSQTTISSQSWLKLHYQTLAILFICANIQWFFPKTEWFQTPVKIWSQALDHNGTQIFSDQVNQGYLSLSDQKPQHLVDTKTLEQIWFHVFIILFTLGMTAILKQVWQLWRLRQNSFLVRKIGNVEIRTIQDLSIPFSFYLPGKAYVMLPTKILTNATDLRVATLHELQHHRQRDTLWVYPLLVLNLFCFINPFMHLWCKWVSEIQEFACDDALVDRKKVSSLDYASCLFQAAQTQLGQTAPPACATGFVGLFQQNILKRRIQNMFTEKNTNGKRSMCILMITIIASLLTTISYASKGFVQDRRVTMSEGLEYGKRAQEGSAFPIVMNDRVLKQLNRYVGTPEGREFMRKSLIRMETYKDLVTDKLAEYGAPIELMAIPLVESGYQNLSPASNKVKAAGVWQFIASTARIYGLRVDEQVDERMQPELLTDAAMRYLLSNRLRFKDWHLSILAFNLGESAVQKGIDQVGSKNAWHLVENGIENDRDYLPKVMAAIIIMKNPNLVN